MATALLQRPPSTAASPAVDWPAMSTQNSTPEIARPADAPEHDLAMTLDRLGDELRTHEMVEEAVLTLATPDRPSLQLD